NHYFNLSTRFIPGLNQKSGAEHPGISTSGVHYEGFCDIMSYFEIGLPLQKKLPVIYIVLDGNFQPASGMENYPGSVIKQVGCPFSFSGCKLLPCNFYCLAAP